MSSSIFSWIINVCSFLLIGADPSFWVINDFHYDSTYWTTQDSCNRFVPREELGRFGHVDCDAPWELVESSVEAMKAIDPNPEFIVLLGDNTFHTRFPENSTLDVELTLELIQNITDLVEANFPQTMLIPVLGNHDFFPKSELPGKPDVIYDALAKMWAPWIQDSTNFRKGGFYSATIRDSLKAIVLNSNLYLKKNPATDGLVDPAGQFEWLTNALYQARCEHDKVHIFSHVPVGYRGSESNNDFPQRKEQSDRLVDLFVEYHDVILGVHESHVHTDSFRLFYRDGVPVTASYVSPAVTPYRKAKSYPGRNPALRKVFFSATDLRPTDIHQYWLDLSKAEQGTGQARWKLLYTYETEYGVPDLSPRELDLLKGKLSIPGSELFRRYRDHSFVNYQNGECDISCQRQYICVIGNAREEDFDQCMRSNTTKVTSYAYSWLFVLMLTCLLE